MVVTTARARAGFRAVVAATVFLLPASVVAEAPSAAKLAEPPRLTVDTTYAPARGKTIVVRAGGDFQAALDAADPGDVITLEAGATFTGPFTLPVKPGADWVIVRSSVPESRRPPPASQRRPQARPRADAAVSRLPPPGHRVDPSYARLMPKLETATGAVITAAPGAHHYRFIGVEIRPAQPAEPFYRRALRSLLRPLTGPADAAENAFSRQTLVLLGATETAIGQLPHHIIFDRCYIHGDALRGARRGIAMNSRHTAVIDSYLSDFKEVGADSQAIAGWNGAGPFKIVNNYLEGAGENLMFGGADPTIPDLVPADIEIRGNYFAKPLAWKIDDPAYEGTPWTVKNLLELKNARRVLIDGNLFEYNWPHAQNGFAVLFTVRNQDGAAPWSAVEDVTFTHNVLRHVANGINILGRDDIHPSERTQRILIDNNLFDDVGARWGRGVLFQLLDATADVVIRHNTALQTGSIVAGGDSNPHARFIFSDNIAPHNEFGIIGSGTDAGSTTLRRYFPDAIVRKNVIAGAPAGRYPPANFFPASLDDVGFVDRAGGDYRLGASSRFKHVASDGADVGVDFDALCSAMRSAGQLADSFPFCSSLGDGNSN